MKKLIIIVIALVIFTQVRAQWNPSGDNTSSGSLTVGSSANNSVSKFTIRGPNQPNNSGSARDIVFDFNIAGNSIIRSYRGTSWDTYMQFLTTPSSGGDPVTRMHISHNGKVGIGTTTPSALLEMKSLSGENAELHINTASDGKISILRFQDAGTTTWGFLSNYPDLGKFSLYNYQNSNYGLVMDSNGWLGLDTTTPAARLDVRGDIISGLKSSTEYGYYTIRGRGAMLKLRSYGDDTNLANEWQLYSHTTNGNLLFRSGLNNATPLDKVAFTSSGNIGIGTTSPVAKVHINNGNNSYGAILANANESSFQLYTKTLTTQPQNVESFRLGLKHDTNENNGFISFYRGASTIGGFLGFSTNGTERMRILTNGSVAIGTNSTGTHKLAVEGTIGAREIKVEASGWSDFVFANDYELTSLEKVEAYIKANHHLPNIPSEEEVIENGINLGEMDAKLLQKIEELTLYVIEQNKTNKTQQELIEKLEKRIEELEK